MDKSEVSTAIKPNFMRLITIASLGAFSVAALMWFLFGCTINQSSEAQINGHSLSLRLALSHLEQSIGLSRQTELAPDTGMRFVIFPTRKARFQMSSMKMPIDIIFVKDGRVTEVYANAKPGSSEKYGNSECTDVIETRANFASEHGLKAGDLISFNDGFVPYMSYVQIRARNKIQHSWLYQKANRASRKLISSVNWLGI